MQQHHILHALERSFREGLTEHAPLAPVHGLINCIVRVVHTLDGGERIVKVGFLEPLAVSVDVVESTVAVN